VQVAILGPLEVRADGGVPVAVAGSRLSDLIARLALAGGKPVSTDALAAAVWDGDPPADVANALQTLVSRARRVLGGAASVEQSAAGYRLAVGPDDVDALRFEKLIAEGAVAEALALWRGPALADAGAFAAPYALRLEKLKLDATVTLLGRELDVGRAAAHIAELDALTAEHPLDERLAALRMRALAAAGRQADALAAYESLRARLADELGISPGPGLRAAHLEVLRGEVPAPAPADRARTNLRAQLTTFVGREDEVARVGKALTAYRLVTLTGPGGAGKTRLAAEVAAGLRDSSPDTAPDGIWMAELASVTDPADVPRAVLGSVGLRESRLMPDRGQPVSTRDARTRLLDGLADTTALLILDNCEHLIDACAHLADTLLGRCPRLRVIATSREPLGITGESLFVVPALATDPAVRLFSDRAAAVSPQFTLDEETLPLIADIVGRLDGLPLAIELAAARLRTMPLAEASRRLTDRFRLLTSGSRTALPRHRTLRAVVEWSWDLLTPAERRLAERLSVFPAGATPEAAAEVCGEGGELASVEVDELLSSLVDTSLLQPIDGSTRVRMLETIREYGAEKLAGRGETAELRRRHAVYYSRLMSEAAPILLTRDQLTWLKAIIDDRDNVIAALHYWCDEQDAGRALTLAASIGTMSLLLGNDADVATWVSEALAVPDSPAGAADPDLRVIAEAIHAVTGVMAVAAQDHAEDARPAAPGSGPPSTGQPLGPELGPPGLAERLDALDIGKFPLAALVRVAYAMLTRDTGRVRTYVDQGLASQDEWLVAVTWLMSAAIAENEGKLDEMRAATDRALEEFRALGERWGLSGALRSLGTIRMIDGDLDGAADAFTEAGRVLAELGSSDDEAFLRIRLAEVAARRGDLDGARKLYDAARAAAEADGSVSHLGAPLASGALFELALGRVEAARPLHAAAERWLAQIVTTHPVRDVMTAMVAATGTAIAVADGDLRLARERAAAAYQAAVAAEDMRVLAQVSVTQAGLALALGQPGRAAGMLGAAAAVRGGDDPTDLLVRQVETRLRDALGERGYADAYAAGKALSRAEATAYLDPARIESGDG
jgi:predicted ATPase